MGFFEQLQRHNSLSVKVLAMAHPYKKPLFGLEQDLKTPI